MSLGLGYFFIRQVDINKVSKVLWSFMGVKIGKPGNKEIGWHIYLVANILMKSVK